VRVKAVIEAASSLAGTTPRHLATFGPTVDYRSIVTDDLRREMRQRGPAASPAPVWANVSLLVGFAEGEADETASSRSLLHTGNTADPQLGATARTFVQNVYWRHRQTIVDVVLHQVEV